VSAGTATREGAAAPPSGPADGSGPGAAGGGRARLADWARDLAMGARFATSGGRQGWLRTLLTAVGVALGVAVLLLAAAVPEVAGKQDTREAARSGAYLVAKESEPERSAYTVLSKDANTRFGDKELYGRLLQAEGSTPATPPGVEALPGPGEMVVSPALKEYLESPEGRPLAERLDGRIVGEIGEPGLLGPKEMAFYMGTDDLAAEAETPGVVRVSDFSGAENEVPLEPVLLLLVVVACAVLIMPVAVFVATAVRFGGEQRDTRLAALRLVGADAATTRRIAAGESLVGALLGLLLGGWFFLLGRVFIGKVELFEISVFPADVAPTPLLALLVVAGVPATAVAVTIFALRGVAIEPLGLVRKSEQRPRRLWWRLVPPVLGAALLAPLAGSVVGENPSVNEAQISSAVVLLLCGVALLLPWLVERLVGRLRGGPLSWQLAVRRLQLASGNASRAVSGITIAVAGAIALQMLFSAVETEFSEQADKTRSEAPAGVYGPHATPAKAEKLTADLKAAEGAHGARGFLQVYATAEDREDAPGYSLAIADCGRLREVARLGECSEGDAFYIAPRDGEAPGKPAAGAPLQFDDGDRGDVWRVPSSLRTVEPRKSGEDGSLDGLLVTPSALDLDAIHDFSYRGWVFTPQQGEGLENVRTAVFHIDPAYSVFQARNGELPEEFATVRRAVMAAAVAVLLLIGASMVVSTLEQLRERKRQLSVLVAFGTKRSTLGASVLWQTAVPVVMGIALAVVFGVGLGWGLLRLLGAPPGTDWLAFVPVAGAGAGVIALVTLASLPFLWRMMRPDGLRTE
jgi:hypothetical protein